MFIWFWSAQYFDFHFLKPNYPLLSQALEMAEGMFEKYENI
jgi:hypothetical protein